MRLSPKLRLFAALLFVFIPPWPAIAGPDSGRPAPDSWTIAVIPDTQYYVRSAEDAPLFTDITRWLAENREKYRIRLAIHVGDIVDDNTPEQWGRAKESLRALDGRMPYVLAVGNHDLGRNSSDRTTMLNNYVSVRDNPHNERIFGGAFEEGGLENAWYRFEQGGRGFVVLSLEFGPRKQVVRWADGVLARHPDDSVILVTHEFVDHESSLFTPDGQALRSTRNTKNSAYSYGISKGGDVHCGAELWDALVSKHANISFVLNGHYKPFERVSPDNDEVRAVPGLAVSRRVDFHADGRPVHQMLFNAQWAPRGGDGWLRLLEFTADGRNVRVWTISPHLEKTSGDPAAGWPDDPELRFTLPLRAGDTG